MKKQNIIIAILGLLVVVLAVALFTRPAEAPEQVTKNLQEPNETESSETQEETKTEGDAESETTSSPAPTPTPSVSQDTTQVTQTTPTPTPAPAPRVATIPDPQNLGEEIVVPASVVVTYRDGRFWPDVAYLQEGGRVHFSNQSDDELWVASDNHPRHDRYPLKDNSRCGTSDFDQCETMAPGTSWTFVFNETGTWGYHNHVDAKATGEIRVIDKDELQ